MVLTESRKRAVYERQVSLMDALAVQGAKIEELSYFFNKPVSTIEEILELECIDADHRDSEINIEDEIRFLETRQEFIEHLMEEEGWTDADLCYMFSVPQRFR